MASFLELLGFRSGSDAAAPPDAIHEIVGRLERLPAERARYVAAFALVLSRVAHADLHIGAEERNRIQQILTERGGLEAEEAEAVTAIATSHSYASGGTEHYLATREFGHVATRQQKKELLECLFSVSAADGSISSAEESQVRQIASELGFSHREFAAVRSRWNDHRAILR